MMRGFHFAALLLLASTARGLRSAPASNKTNASSIPAPMSNKTNTTRNNISQVPSEEKELMALHNGTDSILTIKALSTDKSGSLGASKFADGALSTDASNKTNASFIPEPMSNKTNTTSNNISQVPSEEKGLTALHNGTDAILKTEALSTDKSRSLRTSKFADGALSTELSFGDSQALSPTTTMMGSSEEAIKQIAQSLVKNLDSRLSGGAGKMQNVTDSATEQQRMQDEKYVHERVQEWLRNTSSI